MLKIVKDSEEILSQKKYGDGILLEPSNLINNFILTSLTKYGICPAPRKIVDLVEDFPEKNIPLSKLNEVNLSLVNIFARPDLNNMKALFTMTIKNLSENKRVLATAKAASLFLQYLIENDIEVDFEMEFDIDIEDFYQAYVEQKNKDFNPLILERLLKMFGIFYGKDIGQGPCALISATQQNLLEFKDNINIIEKFRLGAVAEIVDKKRKDLNYSSNNLFNKILEEIESFSSKKGFETKIHCDMIIISSTEEKRKEDYNEIKKLMEG